MVRIRVVGVLSVIGVLIVAGVFRRGGRERGGRSGVDFLLLVLIEGTLKFLFDAGGGLFEFANGFAEAAGKLGQLLATEEHEDDDENHDHFRATDAFDKG
jgi:hypothetical protein